MLLILVGCRLTFARGIREGVSTRCSSKGGDRAVGAMRSTAGRGCRGSCSSKPYIFDFPFVEGGGTRFLIVDAFFREMIAWGRGLTKWLNSNHSNEVKELIFDPRSAKIRTIG